MGIRRDNTRKRHLLPMLWGLIVLSFMVVSAFAKTGENSYPSITVGVPVNRCPIFYQEEKTGEMVGIGVELMRQVAEEAGYSVSFQVIQEETLKEALDNPAYDVIMPFGSAITSASGQSTIVSENLMETPFAFVTRENHEMRSMDELRVGMLHSLGGAIETLHQLFPNMSIVEYDTMQESVNALRAGEVDALLHNSYVWSYVLQKPSYQDLVIQPTAVFSMDFRAGAVDTAKSHRIVEQLNKGIAEMSDTRRQAIILDYTSRRLYHYDFSDIYQINAALFQYHQPTLGV